MKYVIAFPGREAFYRGLDKSFYEQYDVVKKIFEEVSEFLGEDIYYISYIKPEMKVELHTVCLITHCIGVYEVVKAYLKPPSGIIGFSHGEFTALAASESLNLLSVLQLVYELEQLIVEYPRISEGKMARIVELSTQQVEECCRMIDKEGKRVSVAIYISKNQSIISGESGYVDEVAKLAKSLGARWVININAAGAFHGPTCAGILPSSDVIFDRFNFNKAVIPIYSCVDGTCSADGNSIKDKLRIQIARPVMWNKVVENIFNDHIVQILEIGVGCTVSANTRSANPNMKCRWICNLHDLEEILNETGYNPTL